MSSSALHVCSEEQALSVLRAGNPLVVSTDTVFGLGLSVGHAPTPESLFRVKRRDHAKAIAWLMADVPDLDRYGESVPSYAKRIADSFWPGALTLIVRASIAVPRSYCAQDGTIALRVPDSAKLRHLMTRLGCALATSSANVSGMPPATHESEVDPRLVEFAPFVFLSDEVPSGRASTIVDCTGATPSLVRQGDIPFQEITASLKG